MRTFAALGMIALLELLSSASQAAGLPLGELTGAAQQPGTSTVIATVVDCLAAPVSAPRISVQQAGSPVGTLVNASRLLPTPGFAALNVPEDNSADLLLAFVGNTSVSASFQLNEIGAGIVAASQSEVIIRNDRALKRSLFVTGF